MKGAMKSVNKTMKKVMKNKMLMYGVLAAVIGLLVVGLVMCMRKREGFLNIPDNIAGNPELRHAFFKGRESVSEIPVGNTEVTEVTEVSLNNTDMTYNTDMPDMTTEMPGDMTDNTEMPPNMSQGNGTGQGMMMNTTQA
jgi:hypothetical protein